MKRMLLAVGCACLMVVSGFAAKITYSYYIDQAICKQCLKCIPECPNKAKKVTVKNGKRIVEIDPDLCTQDGVCTTDFKCPQDAIKKIPDTKKSKKK